MSWISETETLPNREIVNGELRPLNNNLMLRVLGNPRGSYSQSCGPVTNTKIGKLIVMKDVGPFRVTGLLPAVDALTAIFADIKQEQPDVYAALGSAGMLCARNVRGSTTAISNHSWGCAIDLTLEGKLDAYGDGTVQKGLKKIHPIFKRHGWFWGVAFRKEDAMHFEVSQQLLLQWLREGKFGAQNAQAVENEVIGRMMLGDRGPAVEELQRRLNHVAGIGVDEDGVFGPATRAAVISFQEDNGLVADGIVGEATRAKLGMQLA
jgi:hypothetical protein